eukprot:maker-scaffold279_size225217-snap-gene-0.12 protein:Tk08913 transcript:maker-scaffold279_size225217-snap-gene-0.12-mRNA-1 annotation:"PREDICTED: calmodulin-A-like"
MPAMHAGVVSRNIQRERNKQGGPPPHPYVPRSASGRPLVKPGARGCVKHGKTKGKKGKKGKKDQYDLIVNIDLNEWQLTDEQVAEFKEVFMLFDKDEDGVLTFPELNVVMKSLGQRPSEKELLAMVRDVSEDQIYDTIEFNEFLQMMSKQQRFGMTEDSLKDAFRIFDKDDDGFITVAELRHIMQGLGEKMTDQELDEMVGEADSDNDGLINYEEFVQVLCTDSSKARKKKRKAKAMKVRSNATGAVEVAIVNPRPASCPEEPPLSPMSIKEDHAATSSMDEEHEPGPNSPFNANHPHKMPPTSVPSLNNNHDNKSLRMAKKDGENNLGGFEKAAAVMPSLPYSSRKTEPDGGASTHNSAHAKDRNGNTKNGSHRGGGHNHEGGGHP